MLPIYLKMEGFLTFKHPTEIRFEDFADDGLFLVSGPTGSGKTSIFDAISYALYGVATTSQRSPDQLRSQLIGEEDDFSVEFSFRAGDHDYVIRRWQKGQRLVRQRLIIDGNESDALTKVREINEQIFQVLGLNSDQFCKIVMLPQGEFRNFLAASSKEKSDILRKLFDTEHYAQIREMIRTRLGRIKSQVDDALLLINAEKKVSENAAQAVDPLEIETIISQESTDAAKEAEAYRTKLKLLRVQLKDLARDLEESTRINGELERLAQLEESLAQAAVQEDRFREELALAGRLNGIRPLKVRRDGLLRDEAALAKRQERQTILQDKLASAEAALAAASKDADQNPGRQDRLTHIARALDSLAKGLEDLAALHRIQGDNDRLHVQMEQLSLQQAEAAGLKMRREALNRELESAAAAERTGADEVARLREEYRTLAGLVKAAETWQKVQGDLQDIKTKQAAARQRLLELEGAASAAAGLVEDLKTRLERQGLGRFAHHLRPGEACPLCGSPDHPQPFSSEDGLDPALLQQAEKDLRQLEKEAAQLTSGEAFQMQLLADRLGKAEDLESEFDKDQLQRDLEGLRRELADLSEAGKASGQAHQVLKTKLTGLQSSREDLDIRISALGDVTAEYEKVRDELAGLRGRLEDLQARTRDLDEAGLLTEKKQLEDEAAALRAAIETSSRALRASQAAVTDLKATLKALDREIEELREDVRREEESLLQALTGMDLSFEEYLHLESRLAEETNLRQGAEAFFKRLSEDRTRCSVLREQLKDRVPADLEALQEAIDELRREETALDETCEDCIRRESKLAEARRKIAAARKDYEKAQAVYDIAKRLDLTTGKGTTFENYVLGYYLDGVLVNANQRLKNMTSGRFWLLRQGQDSGGKNKIEGLDLLVFDTYSNAQRDVRTLSGGEGFKAALALALGLSDFIQEKNAGIRLDTIFIDEGFGTLDQESLDSAMETILELQGLGRLVGIISHVEELKERIPTQIRVENRREEGSVLKIVKH